MGKARPILFPHPTPHPREFSVVPDLRARLRPGRGAACLPASRLQEAGAGQLRLGSPTGKTRLNWSWQSQGGSRLVVSAWGPSWFLSHMKIRQPLLHLSGPPKLYTSSPLGHSLGFGASAGLSLSGGRRNRTGGQRPRLGVPLLSNTTQALGSGLKQPAHSCLSAASSLPSQTFWNQSERPGDPRRQAPWPARPQARWMAIGQLGSQIRV